MIDEKLGKVKEGHFHEKKISLLAKEDKIEEDFEKQVFTILLTFIDAIFTYTHVYMTILFIIAGHGSSKT